MTMPPKKKTTKKTATKRKRKPKTTTSRVKRKPSPLKQMKTVRDKKYKIILRYGKGSKLYTYVEKLREDLIALFPEALVFIYIPERKPWSEIETQPSYDEIVIEFLCVPERKGDHHRYIDTAYDLVESMGLLEEYYDVWIYTFTTMESLAHRQALTKRYNKGEITNANMIV